MNGNAASGRACFQGVCDMKLNRKNMLLISFMLFSLFFGAGNLIFPPFMGQNAGNRTIPAMIGFLITAVILPVLGVVILLVAE